MNFSTLSIIAVVASCATSFSQVTLQENFTSPFNATSVGWTLLNNSSSIGVFPDWSSGTGTSILSSYNGAPDDFVGVGFNAVAAAASQTISNWLMTPVVTIQNGAVLRFATRSLSTVYNENPDRLQIRFSTAGSSTAIPPGPISVGTFSNLLLDINPLYGLSTASAVINGAVGGYPDVWTIYTVMVTGVASPQTGRFAFRYFVEDGGPLGSNSYYVALDAVRYTLPCGGALQSFTTCANVNTTLTVEGSPVTSYSWSTGANNTNSIVVNPGSTSIYTVYPSAFGVSCGTQQTVTVTVAAQLGVTIEASETSLCETLPVTLIADPASSTYSWSTGQTGNEISVVPALPGLNVYSVVASVGTCTGSASVSVTVLPAPSLTFSVLYSGTTPNLGMCPGGDFTVAASGGTFYSIGYEPYVYAMNPAVLSPTLAPGAYTFDVSGIGSNGCAGRIISSFSIHPPPVAMLLTSSVVCVNQTFTMTSASVGANAYSWNGSAFGTFTTYAVNGGTTIGMQSHTLTVSSIGGCSDTQVRSVSVIDCQTTGIENPLNGSGSISAFPNPFTEEITLTGFNGRIQIFNMLGQIVITVDVKDRNTINTSELVKGIYLLKAFNPEGNEVASARLIKN